MHKFFSMFVTPLLTRIQVEANSKRSGILYWCQETIIHRILNDAMEIINRNMMQSWARLVGQECAPRALE